MLTEKINPFLSRRAAWLTLIVIVLVGLAMVAIPVWLIMPFKPQTERGLEVSYMLKRWSPLVTVIASVLALLLVLRLWGGARRWWRKAILVVLLLPLLASTWFARQNHFEWMFNPLARATYAKADEAGFVNDSDMVMTVKNNGEAVAYPVRLMAYHHVVQDVVGGTPVVVTY
jgi:hypothetical protein